MEEISSKYNVDLLGTMHAELKAGTKEDDMSLNHDKDYVVDLYS